MIYVISKATYGDYNVRDIQCNANWDCCPYSDYALIPASMVDGILATKGYCDITLNSAGTEVASYKARTIPSVPEECCGTNTVLSVNGAKANTSGEVTLTPAQIGAAPSGYGLGTTVAASTSDINVATPARFFKTTSSTANLSQASRNVGIAIPYSEDEVAQLLIRTLNGSVRTRRLYNGVWTEEWFNPPLSDGTEYQTVERLGGKPVYAMAKDIGALPNNTGKDVYIGFPADELVRMEIFIRDSGGSYRPVLFYKQITDLYFKKGDSAYIKIHTNTDMSAFTAKAIVWYTKP